MVEKSIFSLKAGRISVFHNASGLNQVAGMARMCLGDRCPSAVLEVAGRCPLDFEVIFGESSPKFSDSFGLIGASEGDEGDIAISTEGEGEGSDCSGVNWVRGEAMVIGDATGIGVGGVAIGVSDGDSVIEVDIEIEDWEGSWGKLRLDEVAGGSCKPSAIFLFI